MYYSINEIGSSELRENVLRCEEEILKFAKAVKKHVKFDMDSLKTPAEIFDFFDKNSFFTRDNMERIITRKDSFEYVENTRYDANLYEVIWAFDFVNERQPHVSKVEFDEHLAEHLLYFKFSQSEILPQHEASNSRFFKMYVAGLSYSEDGTVENCHHQLAHNNNNYSLTSILNPKSATRAVQVINQTLEEHKILTSLTKEF